jgi:uncharacterized protein YciW
MAQPRVFVSSTYYDLKYVRSSLELFIDSLGYQAVLSESGDVAYAPDQPLDESCYREVQNCDIYVLIIGGRYGSEISESRTNNIREFFDRYESITKLEYKAAVDKDIPIYILVESAVYAEYQTFRRNRDNERINYAHVDSVNVFYFLEHILGQVRNNPVHTFDRYSGIEVWLRDQWAGWFRELLQRRSSQQQIASLAAQVAELTEVNKTLKHYLEEVVGKVSAETAAGIIRSENKRLSESQLLVQLEHNTYVQWLILTLGVPVTVVKVAIDQASDIADFFRHLYKVTPNENSLDYARVSTESSPSALEALNRARVLLGKSPFSTDIVADRSKSYIPARRSENRDSPSTIEKKPEHRGNGPTNDKRSK